MDFQVQRGLQVAQGGEVSSPVFTSTVSADLVNHSGDDTTVVKAARVSTAHEDDTSAAEGLITYLLKHRHHSPLEHCHFTFMVEAPIFVAREFMRHRTGSFSEVSGRYSILQPKFYVPASDRPLVNGGTSARPHMVYGDLTHRDRLSFEKNLQAANLAAWEAYRQAVDAGVANEVARMSLPLNIYTRFFATFNARNLLHFLSLRVDHWDNAIATYPQLEIQAVAEDMEAALQDKMPLVHKAWAAQGRVA